MVAKRKHFWSLKSEISSINPANLECIHFAHQVNIANDFIEVLFEQNIVKSMKDETRLDSVNYLQLNMSYTKYYALHVGEKNCFLSEGFTVNQIGTFCN